MSLWQSVLSIFSGKVSQGEPPFDETEVVNLLKALEKQEKSGKVDEALLGYTDIVKRWPNAPQAYVYRGNLLLEKGQVQDALADYESAVSKDSLWMPAYYNKGNALYKIGRLEEAAEAFRQAIRAKPDFADAEFMLACVQEDLGFSEAAVESYRRALAIKSDYFEVHCNLGRLLWKMMRMEEAADCFKRAICLRPQFEWPRYNLGVIYTKFCRFEQAVECYREVLRIQPRHLEALHNMGHALQSLGRCEEAIEFYRQSLLVKPDYLYSLTSLLFCLSHINKVTPEDLYSEHCRVGAQIEESGSFIVPAFSNERDKERRLRVGFVSGDFCIHVMADFIEPILQHLSKSDQFELHAYYNNDNVDFVTERFKTYFKRWNQISQLPDAKLTEVIREDGIDILVDMSGHSSNNRLLSFALKPSPIQASWLGYLGTTGMRTMDYYLCDPYFLNVDDFAWQFTEKLVHLPVTSAFMPKEDAPAVNVLPALNTGYLTFGSFNRPSKLSEDVICLWSKILNNLPGSKMLLGAMPNETEIKRIGNIFKKCKIDLSRLEFHGKLKMQEYMALHHRVDFCLDTFPFAGGATINNALWMGVPTLTIAGKTPAGRFGASLLKHVGLGDEFVATDADDFVSKGNAWAANLDGLSEIRSGLRQRFCSSPLYRKEIAGAGFEAAFRIMWNRWCDGLPPESFSVVQGQE